MRRHAGGIASLLLALGSSLPAQAAPNESGRAVRLGVSIGVVSFGGAAEPMDARPDNLEAMPYRPSMWGVTLGYGGNGMRVELAAAYGEPGLALRGHLGAEPDASGQGLLIVADDAFHLGVFRGGVSTRLKQFSNGPALRTSAGLLLERWASPGTPTQTLFGIHAGLLLEVPLTRSLAGSVQGDVGYSPGSPFREAGLPDGFRRRSTWRRGLSGGLVLRL